jgi:hypothetical protein
VRIGGLDESIVSPLSIASRGDESGATQVSEVPRNFRLICLENFNARTDTKLVISEKLNEAQPGAVSQGFEKCLEVGSHRDPDYDFSSKAVSY